MKLRILSLIIVLGLSTPTFAQHSKPATPDAALSFLTPMVDSGLRISLGGKSIFALGDFDKMANTSFNGSLFIGYEKLYRNFGATFGVEGQFTHYSLKSVNGIDSYGYNYTRTPKAYSFSILAKGKFSYHLGPIVPYLSLGIGMDLQSANYDAANAYNTDKTSTQKISMEFGWGLQYLFTRYLSLDLNFTLHPGTSPLVENSDLPKVKHIATGVGLTLYL